MKQTLFSFTIFPAIILSSVTTTNATTSVNVTTETGNNTINGVTADTDSKSETKIRITTNGQTTQVESHESGNINVRSVNGQTTVETSPGMKVDVTSSEATPGPKPLETPVEDVSPKSPEKVLPPTPVQQFFAGLRTLLNNLLRTLRFNS